MNIHFWTTLAQVVVAAAVPTAATLALAASPIASHALTRRSGAFTCLATGLLIALAFTHLIPEAFEKAESPHAIGLALWATCVAFLVAEALAGTIMRHGSHQNGEQLAPSKVASPVILGEAVHTFTDGVVIASAFLVGTPLGWTIAAGVLLHEMPQQLGDYAILTGSGTEKRKALRLLSIAGVSAMAGGALGFLVIERASGLLPYAIAISAASFLYVGMCELVPRLAKQAPDNPARIKSLLAILAGSILALFLGIEH